MSAHLNSAMEDVGGRGIVQVTPTKYTRDLVYEGKWGIDLRNSEAVLRRTLLGNVPSSPYLVHHGERNFLYQWFKSFFDNEHGARENADLMLLYLIIKCKVRREFVQTNNLRGFVNFQDYDH